MSINPCSEAVLPSVITLFHVPLFTSVTLKENSEHCTYLLDFSFPLKQGVPTIFFVTHIHYSLPYFLRN